MAFSTKMLKKSALHPDRQAKAMMDHIRRQKMLKVQKTMKKSFGHRTADVHSREGLIEAIIEALTEGCKGKHIRKKKIEREDS